jgi:hypothetical protein
MSDSTREGSPRNLPRRFTTWPGLLAAVLVAGAAVGAEALNLLPARLSGVAGQVMIAAHALVALATVTLLGEAARIASWKHDLAACEVEADQGRTGWPLDALDDALSRLYVRHSTAELRSEIAKTGERLMNSQQWAWRLGQAVCFLVPVVGFGASLWALRKEGNSGHWHETGPPLLLAVAESGLVLLLVLWVRGAAKLLVQEWRLFAEGVAVERRPVGSIPNPAEEVNGPVDRPPTPPRTTAPVETRRRPAPESDVDDLDTVPLIRERAREGNRDQARDTGLPNAGAGTTPGPHEAGSTRRPMADDPESRRRRPAPDNPAEGSPPKAPRPALPPNTRPRSQPQPESNPDRKADEVEGWY